jgi:group I intron endonuclease
MDGNGVIYRHIYNIDGRSYIGQSLVSEKERTKSHKKSKDSTHFHRAIRKYGWDKFTTEILHENIDPLFIDDWEIYYIAQYDTFGKNGFNMTAGGGGIKGYRHTDTHKKHLSATMSGENNPFYGRTHSEETLLLLKQRVGEKNPHFGTKFTEEHKRKIAKAHLKRVEQWSADGKTYIQTFNSINDAANSIGKSQTGISQCLAYKQKTSGGFTWKLSAELKFSVNNKDEIVLQGRPQEQKVRQDIEQKGFQFTS